MGEGESESGRVGETESGRVGERERGRGGEWESGNDVFRNEKSPITKHQFKMMGTRDKGRVTKKCRGNKARFK
jgi:hypothetical protein